MPHAMLDETSGTTPADSIGPDDALLEDEALVLGEADRDEYGQALLHDSAMAALLKAGGNGAKLSNKALGFAHAIADLPHLQAHDNSNTDDAKYVADIVLSLDIEDFWA